MMGFFCRFLWRWDWGGLYRPGCLKRQITVRVFIDHGSPYGFVGRVHHFFGFQRNADNDRRIIQR